VQQPQVREHVLDLAALVEGDTADHLVGESELAEGVLDRARLGVRAVEHRHVPRSRGLAVAAQALDLAGDELGLVMLVVGLEHHDVRASRALRPEALLLARGVVAHHRVRRVEDALGRAVVPLELHHLGRRIVALEVEDVAHLGAAPGVDGLVVVADDREVLLPAGEVAQQDVLRAVGVLVLVDEDVLEAVLRALEGLVGHLEEPYGEQQQVVEVERVVVAEQALVARPDHRGDARELAVRGRGQVCRPAHLVLGPRDGRGDGAGRHQALA